MKKTRRKVLAITLLATVLCAGTTTVFANSLTRSIAGISFTAATRIDATSATAQTVSGSSKLTVSVDATYHYINLTTYKVETETDSASGLMAKSLNFSVPTVGNYRSIDVSASHEAAAGTETWSGSTEAIY